MQILKTLEKRWKRYPLLVIENYNHVDTPMKDFIHDVFHVYNKKSITVSKKNKKRVAYINSRRSFIDIFGLCRTYYKGCSLEEVVRTMFELCKERKIYGNWFCSTINRYVFYIEQNVYESAYYRNDKVDLMGTITINDILTELDINKEDFYKKK